MKRNTSAITLFTVICFFWVIVMPLSAQPHWQRSEQPGKEATKIQAQSGPETTGTLEKEAQTTSSEKQDNAVQEKKKKKFPVMLVLIGAVALTIAIVLLSSKKNDNQAGPGIEMVRINGGTFWMGSDSATAYSDEKPVHQVTLSSFSIGKYEVTQGQWQEVMGSNPSHFVQGDNYPVETVSWDDVQAFIAKLNQQSGKSYRLPTEAEWEYAARGGMTSDHYGAIDAIAWYDGNSGNSTHPVGGKQANAHGLYDMLGNVWEWVADWYGPYSSNSATNPTGPASGTSRVYRGGSYRDDASQGVRVFFRYYGGPGTRNQDIGFRLALDE